MKLLTFKDYTEYRAIQVQANTQKFKNVFAEAGELRRIAEDFARRVPGAAFGLCHGVRNGFEVRVLRRLLPAVDIRGTDISDTAATIPHCVVWDMHEVKPEWVGAVDFLYSNSWDHTYDPYLLFSRWSQCLSPRGRLYLTYTQQHSADGVTEDSKFDALGCSLDELVTILQRTMIVEDILEIQPRVSLARTLKKRFGYLRAGRLRRVFVAPIRSRRATILVLAPRSNREEPPASAETRHAQ